MRSDERRTGSRPTSNPSSQPGIPLLQTLCRIVTRRATIGHRTLAVFAGAGTIGKLCAAQVYRSRRHNRPGNRPNDPPQCLCRRDLAEPARADRRPQPARHPQHRVPRDPRNQRPRPDRRASTRSSDRCCARAGLASARSGRRSARSRSPSRSNRTSSGSRGARSGRFLSDAPDPDLQLLHAAGRRPGAASRRGHPADGRARRPRGRPGRDPDAREREGDLRRHRGARARHPRDRQLAEPGARLRPGQLP